MMRLLPARFYGTCADDAALPCRKMPRGMLIPRASHAQPMMARARWRAARYYAIVSILSHDGAQMSPSMPLPLFIVYSIATPPSDCLFVRCIDMPMLALFASCHYVDAHTPVL